MESLKLKPLFDEKTIAKRVSQLASDISRDFKDKEIICVGVLKGSILFYADLVRQLTIPVRFEFIGVKSYEGTTTTGHVQITSDLTSDISGKDVLVIEDVVDTGITVDFLLNTLKVRQPASIHICTLLSKPDANIMKNKIDYVGFEISKEFVIGYGLDLDGKYRALPYIAQVLTGNEA
jgi:hypoxanthine phosphoribosyltransferase